MVLATGQITLTDLNDVKQYILYLDGAVKTQIFNPNNSTYTPNFASSNLVITPQLFVSGGTGANLLPSTAVKSIKWYEGTQTDTPLTETLTGTTSGALSYAIPTGAATTTAKTLTIKSNLTSTNSQAFTAVVTYTDPATGFDVTIKAVYEIVKITNGTAGDEGVAALTLLLSNEAVSIPTDQSGGAGNYANSGTDVYLFEGANPIQYDGTGTANGTFKITATPTGITAGAITDGGAFARLANASAMTGDTAQIVITITGKRANGTAISLTRTQTFSKSKTGVAPTVYWAVPSVAAISKSEKGVYSPTSISVNGMSQTGGGNPTAYSTWYRFSESTDGTTFTAKQTSTANATSATFAVPATANLKAIKVEMFTAGSATTVVDAKTIPIVTDGTSGQDSYYLNLWAPNGDTIRNSEGTILLQTDLYKGSTKVTPTAFKWYIQNPAATTTSLGDTDGGAGWELLTSTNQQGTTGYLTGNLTVTAASIAGVEGFKVVATAPDSGSKFSGVIIVRDFQDPIVVNILGAAIFKNGEGSVTLTAQLVQAGVEIPNTGYKFAWALYNANGTLKKTYTGTTDTITVPAADVTGTANLIVDVTK